MWGKKLGSWKSKWWDTISSLWLSISYYLIISTYYLIILTNRILKLFSRWRDGLPWSRAPVFFCVPSASHVAFCSSGAGEDNLTSQHTETGGDPFGPNYIKELSDWPMHHTDDSPCVSSCYRHHIWLKADFYFYLKLSAVSLLTTEEGKRERPGGWREYCSSLLKLLFQAKLSSLASPLLCGSTPQTHWHDTELRGDGSHFAVVQDQSPLLLLFVCTGYLT